MKMYWLSFLLEGPLSEVYGGVPHNHWFLLGHLVHSRRYITLVVWQFVCFGVGKVLLLP